MIMRKQAMKSFAGLLALAALILTGPLHAQSAAYPVEGLARVMGAMHAIAFSCEGRETQTWRNAMLELIDHEAPARGPYRERLIDHFNAGFRDIERQRLHCGGETEMMRARLAEQGRAFSEQLRRTYME
jgi:uncharacterized protein (TIGR02301 family)